MWSQWGCSIKPHCSCKQSFWLRVHGGKELIQLVSQESSFFNHIITAEWPPGFSSGAVQGSAKAEAELCLGSEQRRKAGTVKKSQRQEKRRHAGVIDLVSITSAEDWSLFSISICSFQVSVDLSICGCGWRKAATVSTLVSRNHARLMTVNCTQRKNISLHSPLWWSQFGLHA